MKGEYFHSLDAKGRVNFPAKLREEFNARFCFTRGLDACIAVYTEKGWSALCKMLDAIPYSKGRKIQRFFYSGAADIEPDKQGRVLIPQGLREYAGIDKEVVIIGAGDRVEIWDKTRWEAERDIDPQEIAELMDGLDV